jgi:hypothetical protein
MSQPPPGYPPSYEPLGYAQPIAPRPGILTAVGIISIVVGALSALASLMGIASGFMYIAMANIQVGMPMPTTMPGGTAVTATTGPSGSTVTYVYSSSAGGKPVTAPQVPMFRFNVARGASVLTITESGLSVCAAVLLIVAGSLMLRDSRRADRLHRIYVAVKIPLIAAAATATWWVYAGMMSGMFVTSGGPGAQASFANSMATVQALVWAGISLVYPVALLIVLSTKTSRGYFEGLRSGG